MTPALEVHDLTVAYLHKPVLWNVDLQLEDSQLVGIIGPNGAGKSTLIKAAMGLLPLSSGWVRIYGQPLDRCRQKVAYVPQRESVDWDFPVNAYEVVMMGRYGKLGWFRRPRPLDHEVVGECLRKVGMLDYARRQISQLSGGQQQRIFLARALAQESQVYLMDEPFAGVDAATEEAIMEVLRDLRKEGRLVVVVHHDLARVREYFDSVILLNLRLVAAGPVAETFTEELLKTTYGGRLTLLSEVTRLSQEEHR